MQVNSSCLFSVLTHLHISKRFGNFSLVAIAASKRTCLKTLSKTPCDIYITLGRVASGTKPWLSCRILSFDACCFQKFGSHRRPTNATYWYVHVFQRGLLSAKLMPVLHSLCNDSVAQWSLPFQFFDKERGLLSTNRAPE